MLTPKTWSPTKTSSCVVLQASTQQIGQGDRGPALLASSLCIYSNCLNPKLHTFLQASVVDQ